MSLLKKAFSAVKGIISSPIVRAVSPALGPIGMGVAALGTARAAYVAAKPVQQQIMPGGGIQHQGIGFPSMAGFTGALPAIGRVGGAVIGGGIRAARGVYRSAASYCRKHPGWCQTIGGIAAVEAMVQRGELPMMKARRGRGITATELKNFKRVARFTSKYCAPVRKAMSSRALRGKSCR